MRKIALACLFGLFALVSNAQQKKNPTLTDASGKVWENAILRADGLTDIEGVEAYCLKTTCGNDQQVLVKLVNKNNHSVGVEWIDAIWVNGTWYYAKNNVKKVYLDANSTITGVCENSDKLNVSISSIIDNPKDYQHYTVSGLRIVK